ncbi:MAG: tRNA epoxyqueuosine(34) reductase QueG, partial [Anaerolineae bacterium]|nr:tRNA epoxyqueuosine(34) reductase QueG [Anaerolineae bacterium]
MTMLFPAHRLKTQALELGFNLVGITRAVPSPTLDAYLRWIEAGMHGEMAFLARPDREARRRDLNVILPGARSLVVVGLDYHTAAMPPDILRAPSRGRIAAYAWGVDYHDIMTPRLETLAGWMAETCGESLDSRVYVDTGAILERSHAHEAGLGFTGKNTMLIHPRRGSTFFLGEILTTLEMDSYDAPGQETLCGRCTRCLTACPTGAFPQPHVRDARRCISALTIEHKGWIDRE